ncbi:MAG: MerR family transcriptional regulator [Armatimonadota bacterium]|nr:helix-turn-helix domain-containing protein [bacterium]
MCNQLYNNDIVTGCTARELGRRLGLPVTTLISWVKLGLVTPERLGRGRHGHFIGGSGLMETLAVINLRNAGFSTQEIRKAVENLRGLSGQERPLVGLVLVVSGNDIAWRDGDEVLSSMVSALQQPGQRLMLFPVGATWSALLESFGQDLVAGKAA